MGKILVTGGAGYIGSSLVKSLLLDGFSVIVYDNLSFGAGSVSGLYGKPGFTLVRADMSDTAALESVFSENKIFAVVHLAAIVGDPACAKKPALAKRVNYDSTLYLYDCAHKYGAERFVFASTCSNYGKMSDPSGYVDESSELRPVSLYAELKVNAERYLLSGQGGPHVTILRFATAYGLSARMRFDLTVNEFTKELALGRELEVFGEQFWRPYCHVSDICAAIRLVLRNDPEKVSGRVYNVGDTAENYQKRMIVDEIRKMIPDSRVRYIEKHEDPRDYRVSFEKIKKELGFAVSMNVVGGISEIKTLLDSGLITDPDSDIYKNC
jgi:nucleoside-diphosphate-sugar epimerase